MRFIFSTFILAAILRPTFCQDDNDRTYQQGIQLESGPEQFIFGDHQFRYPQDIPQRNDHPIRNATNRILCTSDATGEFSPSVKDITDYILQIEEEENTWRTFGVPVDKFELRTGLEEVTKRQSVCMRQGGSKVLSFCAGTMNAFAGWDPVKKAIEHILHEFTETKDRKEWARGVAWLKDIKVYVLVQKEG